MTERLYYTDSYLRSFDARVVERGANELRVYLDRTAFYPTSGGQPHDTGAVDGARVIDVVDEGDRIAHLLDRAVATEAVRCQLDWDRRFDHMQQHTGQHLLSAVIAELFGHATTSVHFGPTASTLDLDAAALPQERVLAAEELANAVVTENRPVDVEFEEAGAAGGLRRASSRTGTLRIVSIRDLDRSACGGTHVRATGEIGPILIRRVERVKQSVRLEFLCGRRAVRRARADADLLARIAAPLSAAVDELPALLEAQRGELKQAAADRRRLETELDRRRAGELYRSAEPAAGGVRWVVVRDEEGMTPERLRGLGQAVAALPQAVFLGVLAASGTVLLAAGEGAGLDAGKTLRAALERAGGRGGGNAGIAQGNVHGMGVEAVVRDLLELRSGG